MWPRITIDRDLTPAKLYDVYKWQSNLAERHARLNGTPTRRTQVPA